MSLKENFREWFRGGPRIPVRWVYFFAGMVVASALLAAPLQVASGGGTDFQSFTGIAFSALFLALCCWATLIEGKSQVRKKEADEA